MSRFASMMSIDSSLMKIGAFIMTNDSTTEAFDFREAGNEIKYARNHMKSRTVDFT